jgi:hypothetical protein
LACYFWRLVTSFPLPNHKISSSFEIQSANLLSRQHQHRRRDHRVSACELLERNLSTQNKATRLTGASSALGLQCPQHPARGLAKNRILLYAGRESRTVRQFVIPKEQLAVRSKGTPRRPSDGRLKKTGGKLVVLLLSVHQTVANNRASARHLCKARLQTGDRSRSHSTLGNDDSQTGEGYSYNRGL